LIGNVPGNIYDHDYFSVSGSEYSYEDQSSANKLHYKEISERLVELSGSRRLLADVGCGLGHFMVEASHQFQQVDGFDGFVDPEKFVFDVKRLQLCDLDRVKFTSCNYDAITLNHSLEHVDEPVNLLKQSFNALREDGVIYVEVPYQFHSFYDKICNLFNPKRTPDFLSFHHKTFFTPSSLVLALENVGFQVVSITTFLPARGLGRHAGIKGKVLYIFLLFSSFFSRGDYISVFAKR
jgi:SAM-dependent methyltransferase